MSVSPYLSNLFFSFVIYIVGFRNLITSVSPVLSLVSVNKKTQSFHYDHFFIFFYLIFHKIRRFLVAFLDDDGMVNISDQGLSKRYINYSTTISACCCSAAALHSHFSPAFATSIFSLFHFTS